MLESSSENYGSIATPKSGQNRRSMSAQARRELRPCQVLDVPSRFVKQFLAVQVDFDMDESGDAFGRYWTLSMLSTTLLTPETLGHA